MISGMNSEVKDILEQSSFTVIPGVWLCVKVRTVPQARHFMIAQDNDEITVVTEKERVGELDTIERNKDERSLISLNVSIPFYSVGFLAAISSAIAEAGMNILIISTFSKDYILINQDSLEKAKDVLLKLDIKEA
jgi:hypothetical protein